MRRQELDLITFGIIVGHMEEVNKILRHMSHTATHLSASQVDSLGNVSRYLQVVLEDESRQLNCKHPAESCSCGNHVG